MARQRMPGLPSQDDRRRYDRPNQGESCEHEQRRREYGNRNRGASAANETDITARDPE
jgi:hypothetical protein